MADKHEQIKWQLITDWSVQGKGRLYCMNQGMAIPLQGETPIWFGPLKRKFKGFTDTFGYEKINGLPIYAVVEVKTLAYPKLSKDQKLYMNHVKKEGGKAYIAMETKEGYELKEHQNG